MKKAAHAGGDLDALDQARGMALGARGAGPPHRHGEDLFIQVGYHSLSVTG
jgi:hypothetical protein